MKMDNVMMLVVRYTDPWGKQFEMVFLDAREGVRYVRDLQLIDYLPTCRIEHRQVPSIY